MTYVWMLVAFLCLFARPAYAADFYVTNTGAGTTNGNNEANACAGFGDASCGTLVPGDRLIIVGEVSGSLTVGQDGTASAHITISCEAGSSPGSINAAGQTNGLVMSSRDYLDVIGCVVRNATSHGIYTLGPATHITLTRVVARANTGHGILWTSTLGGGDATGQVVNDIVLTDCQAYDNGATGFHHEFAVQNVRLIRPIAYNNAGTTDGHGISVVANRGSTSSHTSEGGDLYSWTYGFALQKFQPVKYQNTTDGTLLTYTNTSGVFTNLTANQWDYDAAADKVYYNIGGSPTGKTFVLFAGNTGPGYIYKPLVYDTQLVAGEGTGIQFDDGTRYWTIYGGWIHDNEGPGFQCNFCNDVVVSGVLFTGHDSSTPSSRGLRTFFINGPAQNVTVSNSTFDNNGHAIFTATGAITGFKSANNIFANSTVRAWEDPGNRLTNYVAIGKNHYYNNVSNIAGTSGTTDYAARLAGDADPQFVKSVRTAANDWKLRATSPDIRTGTSAVICADQRSGACPPDKPSIGAFQLKDGDPATTRTVATTRSAASPRSAASTRTPR